jgi:hypothetical protein
VLFAEFLQFLAFYLLTVAFLKIAGSWATTKWPSLANGVGWFVPGLA